MLRFESGQEKETKIEASNLLRHLDSLVVQDQYRTFLRKALGGFSKESKA